MSQYKNYEEEEQNEGVVPRSQIRALEEKAAKADLLERRLAFLEAGVDLTSPVGALFAKAFDGKVDDVEAIKAEAAKVGALREGIAPVEKQTEIPVEEQSSTDERSAVASGANTDDKPSEDPRSVAKAAVDSAYAEGKTFEGAIGDAFAVLAGAAMAGDERVVWNP